jgi:hypothetical protein
MKSVVFVLVLVLITAVMVGGCTGKSSQSQATPAVTPAPTPVQTVKAVVTKAPTPVPTPVNQDVEFLVFGSHSDSLNDLLNCGVEGLQNYDTEQAMKCGYDLAAAAADSVKKVENLNVVKYRDEKANYIHGVDDLGKAGVAIMAAGKLMEEGDYDQAAEYIKAGTHYLDSSNYYINKVTAGLNS